MKRREFMNWVGLGFLASSFPVAIAACQSTDSTDSSDATEPPSSKKKAEAFDTTPREDGFAAVGTVDELDEKGFVSSLTFSPEAVAVTRNPTDAAAVVAVGSMCPHQGCTVKWDQAQGKFACPCHGSTFEADGAVVEGPATEALSTFDAIIEGDLVLVQTKA